MKKFIYFGFINICCNDYISKPKKLTFKSKIIKNSIKDIIISEVFFLPFLIYIIKFKFCPHCVPTYLRSNISYVILMNLIFLFINIYEDFSWSNYIINIMIFYIVTVLSCWINKFMGFYIGKKEFFLNTKIFVFLYFLYWYFYKNKNKKSFEKREDYLNDCIYV